MARKVKLDVDPSPAEEKLEGLGAQIRRLKNLLIHIGIEIPKALKA